MITEERWAIILELLERKRTVTVSELEEAVGASASTIRRDLAQLASLGRLRKVHGGAAAAEANFSVRELTMEEKTELNMREKEIIGRYAVSLIRPEDFVYIDAGTTTGMLVEFIEEKKAVFVTNSVMHARKLAGSPGHQRGLLFCGLYHSRSLRSHGQEGGHGAGGADLCPVRLFQVRPGISHYLCLLLLRHHHYGQPPQPGICPPGQCDRSGDGGLKKQTCREGPAENTMCPEHSFIKRSSGHFFRSRRDAGRGNGAL